MDRMKSILAAFAALLAVAKGVLALIKCLLSWRSARAAAT